MPTRAVVLGAGLVGALIADDLARSPGFRVTVADRDEARLRGAAARTGDALNVLQADLAEAGAIGRLVKDFDLVIGALPGRVGFSALREIIDAGRNCCDISFMPEDFRDLDDLARSRGATVVPDCGVAPGLSNMLAARAVQALDPCERLDIYVGGLPKHPAPPHNYKAAFSPADVIEEYTRPARLVEDGRIVTRDALSEVEILHVDRPDGGGAIGGKGGLEAFNTDGLRSLVSLGVRNMREKTLRYPGHAEQMRTLRDLGLFDETPIDVRTAEGQTSRLRPRDLAAALLFPAWAYGEGEPDITVMRVAAEGQSEGRAGRLTWDLYDEYDAARRASSMARCTGYVCSSVARLIGEGVIASPGVIPPEEVGRQPSVLDRVLADLRERGVQVREG